MSGNDKKLSLSSRGLGYKLKISFYLMSVLPSLVCAYLVANYIVPKLGLKLDVAITITVSFLVSLAGFFVIKEVFDHVVNISTKAKLIAAGDMNHDLEVTSSDEVGDLSLVLNELTKRIRSNMDELRTYGDRTTEINLSIQRRVLVLSNLLQISSLISQGADIVDILKLAAEKMRLLANSEAAFMFFENDQQDCFRLKVADGQNTQHLANITVDPDIHLFGIALKKHKPLILDKDNAIPSNDFIDSYKGLNYRNILALPVYLKGRIIALLGIGNNQENFAYSKDDVELLDIFSKQVAIAVENDLLIHRIEKLEIKDPLTGLYNDKYIQNRLQEEIRRAIKCHRPCSFVLVNIDNFRELSRNFGLLQAEAALKRIGSLVADCITEIDRAGRVGDNEFAVILPEKNKRQAQVIAEEIRKNIEFSFSEEPEANKRFTVSAGISENPLDGVETQDLINKAKESLKLAKDQGKNKVAS